MAVGGAASADLGADVAIETIVTADAEPASVAQGGTLTLTAVLKENGAARAHPRWKWERRAGAEDFAVEHVGESTYTVPTTTAGAWDYRATAVGATDAAIPGAEAGGTIRVTVTGSSEPGNTPAAPTTPLVFKPWFAIITFVVIIGLLVAFAWFSGLFDLEVVLGEKPSETDPRAALAAKVIGPILVIAAALIAFGTWMVAVEWRGAFQAAKTQSTPKGHPLTEALNVLKDLKGANLLVIGGIAVIFAVAWMVSATVSSDAPEPAPSQSPSSPATGGDPQEPGDDPQDPDPQDPDPQAPGGDPPTEPSGDPNEISGWPDPVGPTGRGAVVVLVAGA